MNQPPDSHPSERPRPDADQVAADEARFRDEEAGRKLLGWAPPGLERVQGDLWLVTRKMLVAGVVLVTPLVLAIALPQSPHGLGPFGSAWWITLLTTLLGLGLLADSMVALFRLLRRVNRAVGEGYTPSVVGLVVSDRTKDAGFLLQGARLYSELSDGDRTLLIRLRTWTPTLYLIAGFWLATGFGALTLLAARGVVSAGTVATGTLLPPALFILLGLAVAALETAVVRKAKRSWFKRPWAQDLAVEDAGEWRAAAGVVAGTRAGGGARAQWVLRGAMTFVVAAGVVGAVPPATLVPVSSVGAILSAVGGFSYARSRARVARVEVHRGHRLAPDPEVTASDAGEILNVLTFVGRADQVPEGMLPPVRTYAEAWYPDLPLGERRTDIDPFWSDSIWSAVQRGLTAEERVFLGRVAEHPARAEVSRVARAAAADVVGGRYALPFPEEMAFWAVPIPRYTAMRAAANTHLGVAALHSAQGRHDDAERAAREVISLGFLLIDESPLLIGTYVGAVIVERGSSALAWVHRRAGRPEVAELVTFSGRATREAVAMMTPTRDQELGGQAFLERLPPIVADSSVTRSIRWEYLGMISGLTPCLNLRRVVFGPGREDEEWLEQVRSDLVRYPAEAELFGVMVRGFGTDVDAGPLARFMAISMGGIDKPGSCAQLLSRLPSIM